MKREQLIKHHNQSIQELTTEVNKLSQELVLRKLDLGSNKLKNVHVVKHLRHDIARLKTLIRELELSVSVSGTTTPPAVTTKTIKNKKEIKPTPTTQPTKNIKKSTTATDETKNSKTKTKKGASDKS